MSIEIHSAITVPEGDGITVKRVMPVTGLRNFDPFVLWDHFDISGGGFPDHPHRGFEAITYLFDGGMNHTDSLGNRGSVHAGGAQRFTAGRGIVHSEFPDGRAHGIQLWINLAKKLKTVDPAYQQLQTDEIREITGDGVTVRIIADESGALSLYTDVEYLEIHMIGNTTLQRSVTSGFRGFIYAVEGSANVDGRQLDSGEAALIEDQSQVILQSGGGARLMWCFGKPHHEPMHQHGPFVD